MLDLIACPKCGGCGYIVELDAQSAAFLELPEETRQCDGCCAQGYVPIEIADSSFVDEDTCTCDSDVPHEDFVLCPFCVRRETARD